MKNRKNYLKARRKKFKWTRIGYVFKDAVCPICGEKSLVQFYKYDAWGCMSCSEWLDAACGDPACPYCSQRPRTAYEAYWLMDIEAGSAGAKKQWRRDNYQHKTYGMKMHQTRRMQPYLRKENREGAIHNTEYNKLSEDKKKDLKEFGDFLKS